MTSTVRASTKLHHMEATISEGAWVKLWIATQGTLLIPAFFAYGGVLFSRLVHRMRFLPPEAWLNSVFYPTIGAISGGLAGAGVSVGVATKGQSGLALVASAIACIWAFSGSMIAWFYKELHKNPRPSLFSPAIYKQDIDDLAKRPSITTLTAPERDRWLQRSRDLQRHGSELVSQADHLSFRRYWRDRSLYLRILSFIIIILGISIAAGGAFLTGRPLMLISFPSGTSVLLAIWLFHREYRRQLIADGLDQIDAGHKLAQIISTFDVQEIPATHERLRQAFIRWLRQE